MPPRHHRAPLRIGSGGALADADANLGAPDAFVAVHLAVGTVAP